jgi:predicted N-formylglutamate amidohydrolase
MRLGIVLSCEHAGNEVPSAFADDFRASRQTLGTHRGYDPGAHALAQAFASVLGVRLYAQSVTRLLIDSNRSENSPTLFSPFTNPLSDKQRDQLLAKHYRPYRNSVRTEVTRLLERHDKVVHLSVHSFTPELRGAVRTTDIGLLFDPTFAFETDVCQRWRATMVSAKTRFVVHDNEPYRGDGDGLTTTLRNEFPRDRYAGIELEVNQKYPRRNARRWSDLQETVTTSFAAVLKALAT